MEKFIPPYSNVNNPNLEKVDYFIKRFNRSVKNRPFDDAVSLWAIDNNIPILSEEEFKLAKTYAKESGWRLIVSSEDLGFDDTMYTIERI